MAAGSTRQSEQLLDAEAAARRLGTTERHVRRLAHERRLDSVKVGKKLRFDPADLDAFIAANRRPAERQAYE